MRPILYDSVETEFDTNGIGVLSDASSCVAKASLNGQYELTLKYPVTGIHFADIAQRSMILAKSDPDSELQPFRAYRITKPSASGIVTAYARHCAYDLMGIPAAPFTASSASHALVQMKNNAVTDCPFTFYTDKSTAANMTVSVPTPIWTLLGSSKGSILDTYGGEYEFDRWQVKLLNRRGADRGVTIRYGKNLTTLEQDENCANCYTGVYPYWTNTDGTELVQLPEKTLNAPGTYNYVRILALDLSEEWDEAPTEEQLRARAQSYMTANDIGVPTVSWKIEFVQLEQTEEYKELGRLEQVLLGDTVSVYFPDMGIEASARVVEVEYDCILERYKSVTLGSVKANLATTIAAQNKEIAKKPSLSIMERITTALAKAMTGALGGCVRLLDTDDDGMPDELYIADNADPAQAKKVWRGNYEGIAVSKTGYDGPFIMGATVDEGIMSWMITAAQLVAGTIMSADDGKTFFADLDNGILSGEFTSLSIKGKTVDQIAKESVSVGGTNLVLQSGERVSGNGYYFKYWELSEPLEPGQEYTLTVNGYRVGNKSLRVYLYDDPISLRNQYIEINQTDPITKSLTVKIPETIAAGTPFYIYAYYYPSEANSGVAPVGAAAVNWLKLEKGNQSTDWSPAPDDVSNYADKVSKKAVDSQTQQTIFNKLTGDGTNQGIYLKTDADGKTRVYINMSYAKTGKLDAGDIDLRNLFAVYYVGDGEETFGGYIGYHSGSDGNGNVTNGIAIMNPDQKYYVIATDAGVRMSAGESSIYATKSQIGISSSSLDINGKKASWESNGDGTFSLVGR